MDEQHATNAATVTWLLTAVALSLCVTPAWAREHEVEKEIDRTVDGKSVERIEIRFRVGEIEIENSSDHNIHVRGEIEVKGRDREKVEEAAEALELVIDLDEELELSLPKSGHGLSYRIDLKILLPKNRDLDVELDVGTLEANIELPRSARFTVDVGELTVRLPAETNARVEARADVGDVSIRGFDGVHGKSKRKYLVGARFEGTIGDEGSEQSRLELDMDVGSVELRGI